MPPDRPAYGRRSENGPLAPYQGTTYYGLPAVKSSHYGWLIAEYFFTGGLAGSAQLLATVAALTGRGRNRSVVRAGRYLALAGAAASPLLLIGDLHYRRRWYNMLRIFRKTSAMSIGSWTLTAFGNLSGLVALGQFLEDRSGSRRGRALTRWLQLPAGATGAVMSVYTGTLLAATSTPLWASAPRLLPALFGASAASTAAAALSLTLRAVGASEGEHRRVEHFALVAGAAELALITATRKNWEAQGLAEPLRKPSAAAALRIGVIGLGIAAPLVVHGVQALTGRRSRKASALAAVATLLGGFLLRRVILQAGNESGRRPQDYFRFTQPSESDGAARPADLPGEQTWPAPPTPAAPRPAMP